MEVDKRNKRVTRREEENERLKKSKVEEGAASGSGTVATPTEEEVDEFFAILKRMKVAVNYFHQKGSGATQWREALERADLPIDDAGYRQPPVSQKSDDGFDLNAVAPEAVDADDS